jgi:CP family cyanate transporter-like MFS transporter
MIEDIKEAPIKKEPTTTKTKFEVVLMLIGIVFIAANLRAPITSVGPVITEVATSMNLTHFLIGLLTTIPLLSFAFLSAFAPKVARRVGLERLLLYSLLVLAFGLFIRSSGNIFFLFLGAALIGAAITVGNVLMPAFIKKEFPVKVGIVTGVYLVSMNLTSALAAGYSIRIGEMSGLGWQGSIGIWGILALIGFAIWLPQARKKPVSSIESQSKSKVGLWKSRLAWNIAIFMGLQSLLFYCLAAWLPTILQSWGMSADRSGWMLSYIQMAQLPIMLIGPILAGRMKDQTPLVWITFVLLLLGLAGIILGKTNYVILSAIFIGISLGLAFTLAMMFFVLRTKQTSESAELSGMSQTVGYIIAACGPPVFGALFSLTGSWYVPLGMLVLAAIILFIVGLASAKDRFVSL